MSKATEKENKNVIIVKLEYPFVNGIGETVDEITIRRATVKEVLEARRGASEEEMEIRLISKLTGLVPEDIEQMDALCDYQQVQKAISNMGKPQAKKK